MVNQFLVFTYAGYYPCGGWHDFVGDYPTLEEATAAGGNQHDFWHVVDLETKQIVSYGLAK